MIFTSYKTVLLNLLPELVINITQFSHLLSWQNFIIEFVVLL